jgi:hypothetical protein
VSVKLEDRFKLVECGIVTRPLDPLKLNEPLPTRPVVRVAPEPVNAPLLLLPEPSRTVLPLGSSNGQ